MKIYLYLLMIIFIYMLIPNYYYRNLSKKVVKKINPLNQEIALTFDDGPDAKYTDDLLDLLKKHEIKCTFFLIAKKAMQNKNTFLLQK